MNTKRILTSIGIGLVVLLIVFFAVFGSSLKNLKQNTDEVVITTETPTQTNTTVGTKPSTSQPVTTTSTTKPSVPTQPAPTGYTLADVSTHNSATSCWSAIDGNVYDLTNWVNSHPGGKAAILMICGKDGSPMFDAQHGGERKPASILAKYKVGALN